VDLDTGAVVAAELHFADQGDTTTLPETLASAATHLAAADAAATPDDPAVSPSVSETPVWTLRG
jgi:hypothetical protein